MDTYLIARERCTGCGACAAGCPKQAIEMTFADGFRYPKIDEDKCVRCKICAGICESANRVNAGEFRPQYYAVIHKSPEVRATSTSGGAFTLFASDYVAVSGKGGVVYGAAYDSGWNVRHVRCESPRELEKLKKSKYVQSDCTEMYPRVEEDLKRRHAGLGQIPGTYGRKRVYTRTAA